MLKVRSAALALSYLADARQLFAAAPSDERHAEGSCLLRMAEILSGAVGGQEGAEGVRDEERAAEMFDEVRSSCGSDRSLAERRSRLTVPGARTCVCTGRAPARFHLGIINPRLLDLRDPPLAQAHLPARLSGALPLHRHSLAPRPPAQHNECRTRRVAPAAPRARGCGGGCGRGRGFERERGGERGARRGGREGGEGERQGRGGVCERDSGRRRRRRRRGRVVGRRGCVP